MTNLGASAPFVAAKWFTEVPVDAPRSITLCVIHDMELPDVEKTAERCANYFAGGERKASAHYCIDDHEIIHCVQEKDVAWGAPGGNHQGLHFEHAGEASETPGQWVNAYNQLMLKLSAALVAERCHAHNIPTVWLSPADLAAGKSGITSHCNITHWQNSLGKQGTHTDPGPNFPTDYYMHLVRAAYAAL